MEAARRTVTEGMEDGASGMLVDTGDTAMEDVGNDVEDPQNRVIVTRQVPPRKTQKQRRKALQILAEV